MSTPYPSPQAASPDTGTYVDLLHVLSTAMAPLQALHQQAIEALVPIVQDMVRSGSRDAQRIEHTLDQLLNHACVPEGLALFKALCRHYWPLNPQATASYVHAYREMWDGDDIPLTDTLRAKDGEFATIKSQVGLNSLGLPASERLQKLNEIAISQMRSLLTDHYIKRLAS